MNIQDYDKSIDLVYKTLKKLKKTYFMLTCNIICKQCERNSTKLSLIFVF